MSYDIMPTIVEDATNLGGHLRNGANSDMIDNEDDEDNGMYETQQNGNGDYYGDYSECEAPAKRVNNGGVITPTTDGSNGFDSSNGGGGSMAIAALQSGAGSFSAVDRDANFEQLMVGMLEERDRLIERVATLEESLRDLRQRLHDAEKERDLLRQQLQPDWPKVSVILANHCVSSTFAMRIMALSADQFY